MNTNATIRDVGGTVRSIDVLKADNLRIEFIRRDTNGLMRWHFRNPQMCLFWYCQGAKVLRATISGKRIEQAFSGSSTFALYPPDTEIDGEWISGRRTDYVAVFLPTDLVDTHFPNSMHEPLLAFHDDWLASSLNYLRTEAAFGDELSRLSASGWALQALARLRRNIMVSGAPLTDETDAVMTTRQIKRLIAYLDANLAEKVSTSEMAQVIGISRRHFSRVFKKTFDTSAHRYLTERRIENAIILLSESEQNISDIALESGFSSSQHFAATIKTFTGRTASEIRRDSLAKKDSRAMARSRTRRPNSAIIQRGRTV